jgi:hypothetical protein
MKNIPIKKLYIVLFLTICTLVIANPIINNKQVNDQIYNAILENRLDDIKVLIKQTKNINEETTDGKSIFDAVYVFNNCEAAEILFQNKIDINKENKDGISIYCKITKSNNEELIRLMKKYYNQN